MIKKSIIKSEYFDAIFAGVCLLGLVLIGITDIDKTPDSSKCDRDSSENFAVKRMTVKDEIIFVN